MSASELAKLKIKYADFMGDLDLQYLEIIKTSYGRMAVDIRDGVIGHLLKKTGEFQEKEILELIYYAFEKNKKIKLNTFIDIGANIGTHTVYSLANGFKNAISIEACEYNYKLLRINLAINKYQDRVDCYCMALSDTEGNAIVEISPDNFGDCRIQNIDHQTESYYGESRWNTSVIKKTSLDRFIEEGSINLDNIGLIWIDTQGHEASILNGSSHVLVSDIPIVFEFWPYGLERNGGFKQLSNIIEKSNRRIYDLNKSKRHNKLVETGVLELGKIYQRWLANEIADGSPHTNLLML